MARPDPLHAHEREFRTPSWRAVAHLPMSFKAETIPPNPQDVIFLIPSI